MPVSVKHLVKLYLFTVSSTKKQFGCQGSAWTAGKPRRLLLLAGFLVKEGSNIRMDQV